LVELAAYPVETGLPLIERPQLVALNKIDVPEARELASFVRNELENRGYRVFEISTVSHEGLTELTFAMAEIVSAKRQAELELESQRERIVLRPRAVDESPFDIRTEGGTYGTIFRILGVKPERWVQQTDFANDEAVGYLADRLAKLGVEDGLLKAGAVPGSTVVIGSGNGVIFDWEPTLSSAAELITGPRGSDLRLDENDRRTNKQRRDEYTQLMDAKAEARAELEREREAGLWKDDEGE
jgi:GTP-binding protein